jgi:hypothetical protein
MAAVDGTCVRIGGSMAAGSAGPVAARVFGAGSGRYRLAGPLPGGPAPGGRSVTMSFGYAAGMGAPA